jgi:hypothetical protein
VRVGEDVTVKIEAPTLILFPHRPGDRQEFAPTIRGIFDMIRRDGGVRLPPK